MAPPECVHDPAQYCREVEAYLCRKNDGHLIRVVGPSFDLVSRWAEAGVPIKVAFRGIDRYFERYYRKGARRRPVRIDFCENDVMDVFDEWRRAIGAPASTVGPVPEQGTAPRHRTESLPAHLERVVLWLTNARATGALTPEADAWVDRLSRELDEARRAPAGLRGDARRAMMSRLIGADAELMAIAQARLSEVERQDLDREADEELVGYRATLSAEAYAKTRGASAVRLLRERLNLPTITFD